MTTGQVCDVYEATRTWSSTWPYIEELVTKRVNMEAESRGISELHLRLRVLLQLPKYTFEDLCEGSAIKKEAESEAERIAHLQVGCGNFLQEYAVDQLRRNNASVSEVSERDAQIIHERFHYLHSFRCGQHFGLHLSEGRHLAALATVSSMDVVRLRPYTPKGQCQRARLVSRVFAFPWAPRNSISYLLSGLIRELRTQGGVDRLLTWVNPNLCFHASSYRAANWTLAGTEPVVYRYIDGVYVTARELHWKGFLNSPRFSISQFALAPLEVWHYILQ